MINVVSLLCPTRGRPAFAERLMESVARTAAQPKRVELLFYVDGDDPERAGYEAFAARLTQGPIALGRCTVFVGEPMSVSRSWNVLARQSVGDLLVMANDDQVYVDAGWDARLDAEVDAYPDGIFCMWFNDGINGGCHCAFPIVSRVWCETLGYFTPGIFEFLYNDTWVMDIAARVGRTHYIPDVLVEHRHFTAGKSEFDDTYRRHRTGASDGRAARDGARYAQAAAQREQAAVALREAIGRYEKSRVLVESL
jgi:glycosyl transferase/beta-hydroxylase protein BlmF